MTQEDAIQRPKSVKRTVLRVLALGAVLVAVALVAGHFAFKYSGSDTWVQEIDKNGVKVYSLKTPGSTLKRFKAVTRVKTTLSRAVAAMASTDTEDCAEWAPGCTSEKAIQPWNSADLSYTHLYRLKYPAPFEPREFLIRAQISQDSPSKAVLVDFKASPDEVPRNACCLRVEALHNTWRFSPLENGEVEVEATMNTDQLVPYFLVNRVAPRGLYIVCHHLQRFLNKDKWQHAKFDLIKEK